MDVRRGVRRPEPSAVEILDAAQIITEAERPVVLAGNGVLRVGASPALREFSATTGIPVAETFMGKGGMDYADERFLGTTGVQSRDFALAGFEEADVVITVGYDLVEQSPLSGTRIATSGSSASTRCRSRSMPTSSPRPT